MENLKAYVTIKPTIYNKILFRTLMILVYLNLLSDDDAVAYYLNEAAFKWRIGSKGKWQTFKPADTAER